MAWHLGPAGLIMDTERGDRELSYPRPTDDHVSQGWLLFLAFVVVQTK